MVLGDSPLSEYVVAVDSVLDTMVDHVEPLSLDLSTLYPEITEPSLLGAIQERLICEKETGVVERFVGAEGIVTVE